MKNTHKILFNKQQFFRFQLTELNHYRNQAINNINERYDYLVKTGGEYYAKHMFDALLQICINELALVKMTIKSIEVELRQLKLSIKNSQKIPSKKLGNFELIE
jgi:hypothetical protein